MREALKINLHELMFVYEKTYFILFFTFFSPRCV